MVKDWRKKTFNTLESIKTEFIKQIESFALKFKKSIEMVEKKKATSDLDEFDVA